MPDVDWEALKHEYAVGTLSYREISRIKDIPLDSIRRRAKTDGWVSARKEYRKTVQTIALQNSAKLRAEELVKTAIELDNVTKMLLDNIKKGLASIDGAIMPRDAESYAKSLKYIRDTLGIKPEADQREQEARIANLRRQADMGIDDSVGAGVIILPDVLPSTEDGAADE